MHSHGSGRLLSPSGNPWTLPDAPDMDMTPVRINISLPRCVLENLDRKASA